jgi:hypothetical protein
VEELEGIVMTDEDGPPDAGGIGFPTIGGVFPVYAYTGESNVGLPVSLYIVAGTPSF